MDRLERVTDLLLVLLDTDRPLSLREIADRVPGYPTSTGARRQAFERDKRLLREEGVPLDATQVGGPDQTGYRIDRERYYLPRLDLAPEEQAALNLAVAGVHLGEPSGVDALGKLGAGGPNMAGDLPVIDLPSPVDLPLLPVLFEAVRQAAGVAFDYRGARRHVAPAGLRFHDGHWYLVAHDRDRAAARTFRVDRIEGVPEVGAPGSGPVPDGFDRSETFSTAPWRFGPGDEVEVELEVEAVEAGRVHAELGDAEVRARRADGSASLTVAATDVDALLTWVLGLLDHAEIVGPPEVRAAMIERLRRMAGADGA